jgi:hypothetical protein
MEGDKEVVLEETQGTPPTVEAGGVAPATTVAATEGEAEKPGGLGEGPEAIPPPPSYGIKIINNDAKECILPYSKIHVKKRRAKGYDAIAAGQLLEAAKGDMSMYIPALIATVCLFDGKKMVMEDIPAMDFDDYNELLMFMAPETAFHLPAAT